MQEGIRYAFPACELYYYICVLCVYYECDFCVGATYHVIKSFAQHNYQLNRKQPDSATHTTWPMVAIMSDNIVMWKKTTGSR